MFPARAAGVAHTFFMAKKSMQKKATTSQNSNNVLPRQSHLLVADIIGVLRARGLNAQFLVNFEDCSLLNVSYLVQRSGFYFVEFSFFTLIV